MRVEYKLFSRNKNLSNFNIACIGRSVGTEPEKQELERTDKSLKFYFLKKAKTKKKKNNRETLFENQARFMKFQSTKS